MPRNLYSSNKFLYLKTVIKIFYFLIRAVIKRLNHANTLLYNIRCKILAYLPLPAPVLPLCCPCQKGTVEQARYSRIRYTFQHSLVHGRTRIIFAHTTDFFMHRYGLVPYRYVLVPFLHVQRKDMADVLISHVCLLCRI